MAASASPAPEAGDAGFVVLKPLDHVRTKSMWGGSLVRSQSGLQGLSLEGGLCTLAGIHCPALLKAFDELIANATDHAKAHPKAVTRIVLRYDADGTFVCYNDGPGIPVTLHPAASAEAGRPVYVPEVAFCYMLAGTNMEKPADCIKGGTNGVGAKLANVFADVFDVETHDGRWVYRQRCSDQLRQVGPPQLTAAAAAAGLPAPRRVPHTLVQMRPAYGALGYPPPLLAADLADIGSWLRLRAEQVAAYVGPRVAVSFNGQPCRAHGAEGLLRIYLPEAALAAGAAADAAADSAAEAAEEAPEGPPMLAGRLLAAAPPHKAHPWEVAFAVSPAVKKFTCVSVLNGVVVSRGPHSGFLRQLLVEAALSQLRRSGAKPTAQELCRHLLLVVVGALPGAEWSGQRKDELQYPEARLGPGSERAPGAGYHFPAPFARAAGALLAEQYLLAAEGRRRPARPVDKYTPARRRGGNRLLLAAEGDSPLAMLRDGLTGARRGGEGPSFDNCGLFSLGGVPINALKQVRAVPAGGSTLLVRSPMLRDNKMLQGLVQVLGLRFDCAYATEAERAALPYRAVVACVDQDLDGCGKILGLLLVFFHTFWPELVRAGFVRRFLTPVVRVYPGRAGPPVEFYYEQEYERWRGSPAAAGDWRPPVYYKGLAGHSKDEVRRMFSDFYSRIYTFTLDDSAAELFRVYFGTNSELRKRALAQPVLFPPAEQLEAQHRSRSIACGAHLGLDTAAYKLEAVQRQLPSFCDGLTPARRKVLAGARARHAADAAPCKVFQLGGRVAEEMAYHHGDASLNATIVAMAQGFPGAYLYPLLDGSLGQFGTRHLGGHDHGQPRYLNVRLNAALVGRLFPAADDPELPRCMVEGREAEPRYYLPVLPMAVLESGGNPSEGWRYACWARDLEQTAALALAYARGEPDVLAAFTAWAAGGDAGEAGQALREAYPLEPSRRGFTGQLQEEGGRCYSLGRYDYEPVGRLLRVTELPMWAATETYAAALRAREDPRLLRVDNYSTDDAVDLRLQLAPGAYEAIGAEPGGVVAFLRLRAPMDSYLNYVDSSSDPAVLASGVAELGRDYHRVVARWAVRRGEHYRARFERRAALLRLRLRLEEALLRYLGEASALALEQQADEAAAERLLAAAGYPALAHGLITAPGRMPRARLEALAVCPRGEATADGEPGTAGYGYILDLRARDLLAAARARRAALRDKVQAELAATEALLAERPLPGASVWRAEIAAALEIMRPRR